MESNNNINYIYSFVCAPPCMAGLFDFFFFLFLFLFLFLLLFLLLFLFLVLFLFLFLFLPLPLPLPRRCRCLFYKTRAPRCGSTFWGSSVGTVYILGVYTLGSVYTLGPRLFEAARSAARRILYVYIHIYIYMYV